MSKIARIYQGINEIQKYYQGGVLQRLFFDWKHYIGNELNIEYAKECAGRNVVISGKTTIQGVPSDYTILDYIECTGTQYIDTGFKANTTTTKFVGAFTPTKQVTGALLGSRNDTSSGAHSCNAFVLAEGKFRVDWANGNNLAVTNYVVGTKYEMEITRGTLVVNGTTKSFSATSSVDQLGNFLIGTFNNVTEPYADGFIGYIHECKLYSNDILVRNFVPVIRNSDNEVGMYDTVTNTFYTNSGVNSFIAGEKVVNEDIESVGENEDNLVTIRNYNYKCDTDNIVLPDGTKNEISYSKGKHIHTRKIGKYIISGGSDETISIRKNLNNSEYITFNVDIKNNMETAFKDYSLSKKKMICDKLEISVNEFEDWIEKITKEAICMRNSGLGFCISILRSNLETEDIDGFKTYLAENPLEVYYELAEPVITELYYNDITYKLNEPLRSLPNGVCDTIEGNKLIQRVGKIMFDGSNDESWEVFNSSSYFTLNHGSTKTPKEFLNPNLTKYLNAISNISISHHTVLDAKSGYGITYCYFWRLNLKEVDATKGATVDDLKSHLKENPITAYYELATPIETEITPDMILINGEPITDTVGIELPNGTKDIIEKGIYTKNINRIVLDGSDDELWVETNWSAKWGQTHNGAKVFEYRNLRDTSYMASNNQNNFLYESTDTTLSPYYGTNSKELPENAFICKGAYIDFGCHFDTVEDFRNFLAENPFTIQYELSTPIKIPLFSIKEGLTTLKSTNNITPQIELDCLVRDDFQNMCDNVWESGNIDSSTGLNSEYGTRIRLKNFIKVVPNTNYRIDITNLVEINNVGYIGIRYYDLINNYINYFQVGNLTKSTFIFTTPEDCHYIRFIVETKDINFKIYLKEVIN